MPTAVDESSGEHVAIPAIALIRVKERAAATDLLRIWRCIRVIQARARTCFRTRHRRRIRTRGDSRAGCILIASTAGGHSKQSDAPNGQLQDSDQQGPTRKCVFHDVYG